MIVISAGLQKSGSGLYFNVTNDLLIEGGMQDVRTVRDQYGLNPILRHANCNVGELTPSKVMRLLVPNLMGNSFVIKTHNKPTTLVKALIDVRMIRATCIYRDPRDVVLSAMDHGRKIREKGENYAFASCTSIENTIPLVRLWIEGSIVKWLQMRNILRVRYEDLIANPGEELKRLAMYLNIDASRMDLNSLYDKYHRTRLSESQADYLHFNQGVVNRFRTVFTQKELAFCNSHLGDYLQMLGYEQ